MTVNKSGFVPVEYKVLVKPDPVEKQTESGIILPDESHEREGWAQVRGTLVAFGEKAFSDWGNQERSNLRNSNATVRVCFDKYQGTHIEGADGEEYVLMNDKNIGALIIEEGNVTHLAGRKPGGLSAA